MLRIFRQDYIPYFANLTETRSADDFATIVRIRSDLAGTCVIFFMTTVVLFAILTPAVQALWNAIDTLFDEVSYLSDSAIAMSRNTNLKRNNILDLVPEPCAMVDAQVRVVGINTHWLATYDESYDRLIGRSIGEFMKDARFQTIPIEGTPNFLVFLKEGKEEVAMKARLQNSERDLSLLKSVNTPRRFLSIVSGQETTHFALILNICQIPMKLESLSPESWPNDCEDFEEWLRGRVQDMVVRDDCDVLHFNVRETSVVFGVGEQFDPHVLVLSAVTLAFDILRFCLESEWSSGAMPVCLLVSCGSPLTWTFERADVTDVSAFGQAVEKQMILRECAELNSIVLCADTIAFLDFMNLKLGLERTWNGNYIYISPPEYV
jgi:hypothetical protein